jgi:hypothetical protein
VHKPFSPALNYSFFEKELQWTCQYSERKTTPLVYLSLSVGTILQINNNFLKILFSLLKQTASKIFVA